MPSFVIGSLPLCFVNLWTSTYHLLKKEVTLEWRQKFTLSGVILYVFSTVFVVYLSFVTVQIQVWNTLFWIIMMFASTNAIMKSFIQENGTRQLYYYTLVPPTAVILSKIIYNVFLLTLIGLITYFLFIIFAEDVVRHRALFLLTIFLGSVGFSIVFTFVSAIASKASNGATLMAILSFPIIIPILTMLIQLSANAVGMVQNTAYWKDIGILISIDAILLVIVFILFPFLWKD